MTYAIIYKLKGKIKLASTTGYRTKKQAEQMKRVFERTNKGSGSKYYVRKVS